MSFENAKTTNPTACSEVPRNVTSRQPRRVQSIAAAGPVHKNTKLVRLKHTYFGLG